MLALIHENTVVSQVGPGSWFDLPDGSRCSPAEDGWTDGTYRLAAILPADEVPEGKRIVSTSVEIVEGQPKYVHVLEDVPPPDRVSSRQFKLQLLAAGLLDDVEAWVALQDRAVQIAYANSATFVRTDDMMQSGFAALGFTEQQIDAFFAAASEL